MENYTISVAVLVEIFGIIAALGAAWGVIHKWVIKPINDRNDQINNHEERLEKGEKRFEEITEMQKMNCKCMLALIDHEITGNGIEKLKDVKTEVQSFLIDKS